VLVATGADLRRISFRVGEMLGADTSGEMPGIWQFALSMAVKAE